MSAKNVPACLFFLIFWIVPLTYTGITNRDTPFLPRTAVYLQRISFLFTHASPQWPVYYIEGKTADSDWFELNENDYFKLRPFGYRTRLHQFMINPHYAIGYARGAERRSAREAELASWIAERYSGLYPSQPKLTQVRFLQAMITPGHEQFLAGHWRKPGLNGFSKDQIKEVSAHNV